MFEEIIDELVESISKMVCKSKNAPMDLKAMSMLSILNSKLPVFWERMASYDMAEKQKYGDKFESIVECAEKLIGAVDDCLAVSPEKKSVEDESGVPVDEKPEDTLGIRFLGKEE